MRKALVVSTALAVALGAGAALAHDPAAERAERLADRLSLTEEQQAEAQAIFADAHEQGEALRAQARENRKAAMEQRKALREQSQAIRESTDQRLSAGVDRRAERAACRDARKPYAARCQASRDARTARGQVRSGTGNSSAACGVNAA